MSAWDFDRMFRRHFLARQFGIRTGNEQAQGAHMRPTRFI
jgi:hypothetical protein